jgi:hypothetical protein
VVFHNGSGLFLLNILWEKGRYRRFVCCKLFGELLGDVSLLALGQAIVCEDQKRPEYQRNESRPLDQKSVRDQKESGILRVPDVTVNSCGDQVLAFALVNERPTSIKQILE